MPTGLLPLINKTILADIMYFPCIKIKFKKEHNYTFTLTRTTYFKYCEAVHHDVLIASVGEEKEAVAPRSILLSEIIQQLLCRKKEVGMRCKTKLSSETKMNAAIQEAAATFLKLKCHGRHGCA